MNEQTWEYPPQDVRQTANEAREAILELAQKHPSFTAEDLRQFAPLIIRLKELSE